MESKILIVILGASLVNYIPRMLPAVFLSKIRIPGALSQWLDFVPAAVLAALVAQEVCMPGGGLDLSLANKNLLAALPTLAAAILTRSLALTLLAGIASAAALHYFLGL